MRNALTIDVEDYFHVSAFEGSISRDDWDRMPQRVPRNTEKVLDLLQERNLRATFFILGWVAERWPALVRRIAREGHEVACHGYAHQRVTAMNPESFTRDVTKARKLLQDISGQAVEGYRAPSFTITGKTLWALDTLIEAGFRYDSSIFPIRHDIYGMPGAERFMCRIQRESGSILEFPPTTLAVSLLGKTITLPVAGGGYLRLLPVRWFSASFARLNKQGRRCMLYFHPWEIDPDQPRIKAPLKSRFRHYLNLSRTEDKLRVLLHRHAFAPMGDILTEVFPDD